MKRWNKGLCVFLSCAVIALCGCASLGDWVGGLSVSEDGRISGRWESTGSEATENVTAIALAGAAALGVPFAYPVQRALRRRRDATRKIKDYLETRDEAANGGAAKG